jgi:uncharacterized repeat protein (TIGR01451 family)
VSQDIVPQRLIVVRIVRARTRIISLDENSSTASIFVSKAKGEKQMKNGNDRRHFTHLRSLVLISAFIIAVAVVAVPLYSVRSSSLPTGSSQVSIPSAPPAKASQIRLLPAPNSKLTRWTPSTIKPLLPVPPSPPETIVTFAADCTTPQTSFTTNDIVCTKIADTSVLTNAIYWVNPDGARVQVDSVTGGTRQVVALGVWKVYAVDSDGALRELQRFSVSDPAQPKVDLSVFKSSTGASGDFSAGGLISYQIVVQNNGPDTASSVQLTDSVPANTTYVSSSQDSGSFTRTQETPATIWTAATLAPGASGTFTFTYQINSGTPAGTVIANTVNIVDVTNGTDELSPDDNTWVTADSVVAGGGGATCSLDCPNNIAVSATTHGAGGGAVVDYSAPEAFGDCGTVSFSQASHTFFPIGTTTVTSSSSTGGGFCSFTVTVIDSAAPTISCPGNITVTANSGQSQAFVPDPNGSSSNPGTPTATGDNVVVTGGRSDGEGLTTPYPVGVTTITWTATECTDPPLCENPYVRSASCTQTITVIDPNPLTITCPANQTVNAPSGTCEATVNPGTATATPGSATVVGVRSDGLSLTADTYPAGQTTITWTATATDGRTTSCTQTITVNGTDATPPTLTIPPDVSVTTSSCSALLDDELGVATATDNCSASVNIVRTGVPRVPCPIPGNPTRTCESFVFPVGTTDVTYTATDASGNVATGIQHVTVHETTPPTFTFVPGNVGPINNDPGLCGAFIGDATLGTATVFDNCDTTVIRSGVPAGNIFPVGQTTITYTAKADLSVTATQIVTVVDNTPPVVTAPGPVTLNTGPGATSCGVTVTDLNGTFGTGSATDNCPGVGPVTRSGVPAGNFFPVGPTTLTYSATDAHNNTGSANQLVTVVDNTLPTISCQADIIADFNPAVNGAVVTYTAPVGTDNCASNTTQIAGLPSGSTFPTGTTTNTFKVTDASGNTAQCSFKVTVALTSIIGLDSVSLSGNALLDSYDSTGGYPATKGSLANLLSNGTLSIAGSSKVFGNVRSTRVGVSVQGTSQVTGNATAGTTVTKGSSAIIGGTITNNALAPVMTLPSVPACGPPYSPNTGISGTYSYNASTGDLSLSGINIATLANGSYCFHNVTLTNSGQLKVNGPVTIKLTGAFNAGGASTVNNTTLIPANLRILSSYSGSNGVIFSNGNSAYLLIYAPTTSVANTGSAPLFGTIVGKSITLSNSGMIHYDTRLKTIWPDIWTLIFGP